MVGVTHDDPNTIKKLTLDTHNTATFARGGNEVLNDTAGNRVLVVRDGSALLVTIYAKAVVEQWLHSGQAAAALLLYIR